MCPAEVFSSSCSMRSRVSSIYCRMAEDSGLSALMLVIDSCAVIMSLSGVDHSECSVLTVGCHLYLQDQEGPHA